MKVFTLLFSLIFAVPVSAQTEEAAFSRAELDQMLAPIALYPDVVLSHVLMASTYPLEVVQAARWSLDNPDLKGERAVEAVSDRDWDPSVKALVAVPKILERMNEDLEWTQRLGDAFLFQETQVMDTIQDLRKKAYVAGNLDSSDKIRVYREEDVIVIEPANPRIVYVPYYNPRVIYGNWWWPAYQPVYWGPPPGYHASTGFFWSSFGVSTGFFFGAFDWPHHHVVIVHHHHHHKPHKSHSKPGHYTDDPRWRHNPTHRRGVDYRHPVVRNRYAPSRTSRLNIVRRNDAAIRQERETATRDNARPRFSSGGDRRNGSGSNAQSRQHRSKQMAERRAAMLQRLRENNENRGNRDAAAADNNSGQNQNVRERFRRSDNDDNRSSNRGNEGRNNQANFQRSQQADGNNPVSPRTYSRSEQSGRGIISRKTGPIHSTRFNSNIRTFSRERTIGTRFSEGGKIDRASLRGR